MPRNSSSSSRSKPLSFKSAVFQTPRAPVALPRAAAPLPAYRPPAGPPAAVPAVTQVQMQPPGFFSSVIQGFGLGAGQSFAFNMFRSPEKVVVEHRPAAVTDRIPRSKEYTQCMEESKQDEEACRQFIESAGGN